MTEPNSYQYLEPRTGTRFRQLFFKGRRLSAEDLYRQTIGEDPRTPEEVAEDFDVPVDAVREAINYCTHHEELLRREREEELARSEEFFRRYPPLQPPNTSPGS